MSNQGFQRLMEGVPAPSGSGNRPESSPYEAQGKKCADYLAWIMQEGGSGLISFLLSVKASAKTLSSYFVVFAYIAYNLAQS
jgi:hypothetical protein